VNLAPLEGVTVRLALEESAPLTLTLAGAWLEEGGDGEGVDAKAVIPTAPPLEVTAHRSRWRLADQVVVFEGRVVATRGPTTLVSERLELTYTGERVHSGLASGGVVVTHGPRRATADRAALTVDDGRIELTGDPQLVEGPNRLSGERITLFLDDEEMVCDACTLVVSGDAVEPLK